MQWKMVIILHSFQAVNVIDCLMAPLGCFQIKTWKTQNVRKLMRWTQCDKIYGNGNCPQWDQSHVSVAYVQ